MRHLDICWMSAVDLAKLIRKKKLSPVEVVRDILGRIEVVNPKINAYVIQRWPRQDRLRRLL
jgi:Asp-tRNA(Asn)/Glu-tRNA(Gln) amidotransferase A subunit family amidase